MWPPCNRSECPQGSSRLRSNRRRALQGWVCGRVEGGMLRSGRRSKGHQAVFERRVAEGHQRRFKLKEFVSPSLRLIILCVEILQGSCDVEIPSTPKHPATDRGGDVRNPFRNGIGMDGKRKYQ